MTVLDKLRITSESGDEFPTEFEEEFAPDPEPNEKPRRSRKEPVVKTVRPRARSTDALAKQVGNDLGGCFEMVAAGWSMMGDDCCSPVLEAQAKPIGVALANILKRYPNLLAKLSDSDWFAQGMSFAMLTAAIKPVGMAVYHNHIVKDAEGDHADPDTAGLAEHFSNLTPSFR